MVRRLALLALAVAASAPLAAPPSADSQTIVTNPVGLIDGDRDEEKPNTNENDGCSAPTLVCAAETAAGAVGDAAAAGAGVAADAAMGGVVSWAADGAAWLVSEIGARIDRSTRPAVGSAWFTRRYASMVQLAIALSAAFLLLAAGQAIVRQDLLLLARAAFVALPLAMMLTFAAVTLVEVGLAVTDWMTSAVLRGFRADVRAAFGDLAGFLRPSAATGSPLAPFVLFLASVVTALLALLVWMELVMREAAIYVTVAFLPLTLVGMVYDRTAAWSRRLAEWLAAIILSKFTIAVAFAVAASAIRAGRADAGGLTALLAGCGVLLVAALTPWALLKLIPVAEAAAGRGLTRGHVAGAASAAPGAATATVATRQLMLKQFAAKGGAPPAAMSGGSTTPAASGHRPLSQLTGRGPAQGAPVAKLPEAPASQRRSGSDRDGRGS